MERRLWAAWVAATAAAALLAGCGGGADRTKANLRFVNASSGYAALDLRVDDVRKFASVAYGQGEGYIELDPDADQMGTDVTRPGSTTPIVSLTPAVNERDHYTLLAWGAEGALQVAQLDDNAALPDGGKVLLRVFNAAADAGALDVYLTAETDPLSDAVARQAGAAVGRATGFVTLNAGSWRLRITAAGAKSDLRLDLSGLALASQQVATLVLTPGSGGVLVNALLLVQEGAVSAKANTHARVRVVAGVPDSGAVTALVAGQTLMNGAGAPAIGSYGLVPAGDQPVSVSVAGTALASSTVTLAAGSDRTLLVHYPAGTPVASWIDDDNRLPASASKAKLRLVHGMAGNTGAMSLTADALPVAGGIAAGMASPYTEVAPGTTIELRATAVGLANPVYSTVDRTLASGGVYTVFVLGGPSPATGLLRQDR